MTDVLKFPEQLGPPDMRGPVRFGSSVIIDGRHIPKIHMHDKGETIELILDERLCYEFPKEWAYHAASFAANAMAIGAGYAFFGAESRDRPFAPQCFQMILPGQET